MRMTKKQTLNGWEVKIGLTEDDYPQAECRGTSNNGSQILMIVGKP